MTRRQRSLASLAGLAATISVAGCGLGDPYQTHATHQTNSVTTSRSRPSSSAADTLDPPAERGGTIPVHQQAAQLHVRSGAGSSTARQAVMRYATLYVNWRSRTLAARARLLARLSIGAARLAALQEAASAPTDRTLIANAVANHGRVISAQPGIGPAARRWVVVTREQTTGQGSYRGLPAQLHVTYAVPTHTRHGWVISQWSPQT